MTAIMVIVEDERKDALRRARATLITRLRLELGGVILVGDVLAASTRTHQPTSVAMPVQHTTVLTTPPRNSGSILGSSAKSVWYANSRRPFLHTHHPGVGSCSLDSPRVAVRRRKRAFAKESLD
jgi:hypothetical protein